MSGGGEKRYNPGLGLIKFIACFCVVWVHNAKAVPLMVLDVPVFVTVAFLFSSAGLLKRLWRILHPFWLWGVTAGVVHLLMGDSPSARDWFWQLTLGHVFCKPLYFLSLLAFYTVLFHPLRKVRDAVAIPLFLSVAAFSWVWQYMGFNWRMFGGVDPTWGYWCGRFFELLPCVCLGLVVQRGRIPPVVFGSASLVVVAAWKMWGCRIPTGEHFGYAGVLPPMLSVCAVLLARWIGETALGGRLARVRSVFDLSPRIYYVHAIVGYLLVALVGWQMGVVRALTVFAVSAVLALGIAVVTRRFGRGRV